MLCVNKSKSGLVIYTLVVMGWYMFSWTLTLNQTDIELISKMYSACLYLVLADHCLC